MPSATLSIEGQKTDLREALWKGRHIVYRPGRLRVALRRGVCHRVVYNALIRIGCRVDYSSFNSGVFEVIVPTKDTLRLAWLLGTNSSMFRYVEPILA